MIYNKEFDAMLKGAVKNRRTPEELFAYQAIKERIEEIDSELAKESAVPDSCQEGKSSGGQSSSASVPEATTTTPLKLSKAIELPEDKEQYWWDYAENFVKTYVVLIAEPETEQQLRDIFRDIHVLPNTLRYPRLELLLCALQPTGRRGEHYGAPHPCGASPQRAPVEVVRRLLEGAG